MDHGQNPLKNFEFFNFEFSYQSNGVFDFRCFNKVGFDKIQYYDLLTCKNKLYLYKF